MFAVLSATVSLYQLACQFFKHLKLNDSCGNSGRGSKVTMSTGDIAAVDPRQLLTSLCQSV